MPGQLPDRSQNSFGGDEAQTRSFTWPWRPRQPSWFRQSPRLVAFGLVAAGALPPIGLAALPGGLAMLGAPRTGIVLITALLFSPAVVGFAVALQGFEEARHADLIRVMI